MKLLGWLTLLVVLTWAAPGDALIGNDGSTLKDEQKRGAPAARENAAPGAASARAVAPPKAKRAAKPATRAKKPQKRKWKPKPSPTPAS